MHNANTQQIDAKYEINCDTTNRVNIASVLVPIAIAAITLLL